MNYTTTGYPMLYMGSMSRIWGEFVRSICLLVHNCCRWFSWMSERVKHRHIYIHTHTQGGNVWNHIFRRSMGYISCLKVWLKSTLHFKVKRAPGVLVCVYVYFRLGSLSLSPSLTHFSSTCSFGCQWVQKLQVTPFAFFSPGVMSSHSW